LVNWLRKKLRQHIHCKKIGDYREIKDLGEKNINSRIEDIITIKIKEVINFDNYVNNLDEEKKEWVEKLAKIPRWRKEVRKILQSKPSIKWTSTIDDLVDSLITVEKINQIVKTVENKTLDKLKEKLLENDNQLRSNTNQGEH